jgi:trehalose synthase-fused probable maltokinase
MLTIHDHWSRIFEPDAIGSLEGRLPVYFQSARWFGRKTRTILSARVLDRVPLEGEDGLLVMAMVEIGYGGGATDLYIVPVTAAFGDRAQQMEQANPEAAIMPLTVNGLEGPRHGLLIDALWDERAAWMLLKAMREARTAKGLSGLMQGSSTGAMNGQSIDPRRDHPSVLKGEQSNTSVRFGRRAILKLYRRPEQGMNPDLELGRALTNQGYRHTPSVLGALEYVRPSEPAITIGIAHQYVENRGDAWSYTLEQLELGHADGSEESPLGAYGGQVRLLGRRTAELHRSLSLCIEDPALVPEAAGADYWQDLDARIRSALEQSLELLRRRRDLLGREEAGLADSILAQRAGFEAILHPLRQGVPEAVRIRCHGDFHLGQVLFTGEDFIIIDFEGEPARPLAERRAKHVCLLDVAGMIRSFHYASHVAARRHRKDGMSEQQRRDSDARTSRWYGAARSAFLAGYAEAAQGASFWPRSDIERQALLELFLLDKALYELSYELNNRPDWAGIPLRGIVDIIGRPSRA